LDRKRGLAEAALRSTISEPDKPTLAGKRCVPEMMCFHGDFLFGDQREPVFASLAPSMTGCCLWNGFGGTRIARQS